MIEYHYELPFELEEENRYSEWIRNVVQGEGRKIYQLSYVFCSDEYLLQLNKKYLDHETLTDIITFPWNKGGDLHGDIYISIERVRENAVLLAVEFKQELKRVMIHGVLHLIGYTDNTIDEKKRMRVKEDEKLKMFHVEQ